MLFPISSLFYCQGKRLVDVHWANANGLSITRYQSTTGHGATFLDSPGLKPLSTIVSVGQNVPEMFKAKGKTLLCLFHENVQNVCLAVILPVCISKCYPGHVTSINHWGVGQEFSLPWWAFNEEIIGDF